MNHRISPALFVWLTVGVLVLAIGESDTTSVTVTVLTISVMGMANSLMVFWKHGLFRISAAGIFSLGTALFVFFPGIWLASDDHTQRSDALLTAVTVIFFSQVLMYYSSWSAQTFQREIPQDVIFGQSPLGWSFWIGVLLMAAGYVGGEYLGLGSSTPAGAAAFVGALMIGVAAVGSDGRHLALRLVLVLAAFIVYVMSMYSGGGRLVLGGLAVALAMVAGASATTRWIKAGALVAIPIGLILLARDRSASVAALGLEETGLESVIAPLKTFAKLLDMSNAGQLDYALGSTFFAAAVVLVPRAWWTEKPVGFGADLTRIFRPELEAVGHSEAALLQGEMVFNFGFLGLVLSVPLIAWFVRWLDILLSRSESHALTSRLDVVFRVAIVVATAGLLDLVWTGSATYTGRTGQRFLILIVVLITGTSRAWRVPRVLSISKSNVHGPLAKIMGPVPEAARVEGTSGGLSGQS